MDGSYGLTRVPAQIVRRVLTPWVMGFGWQDMTDRKVAPTPKGQTRQHMQHMGHWRRGCLVAGSVEQGK